MSDRQRGTDRAGRRRKRFLTPAQKYEIWVQLLRGETTIAQAADQAGVDRSTVMKRRTVAKQGALDGARAGDSTRALALLRRRRGRPTWTTSTESSSESRSRRTDGGAPSWTNDPDEHHATSSPRAPMRKKPGRPTDVRFAAARASAVSALRLGTSCGAGRPCV